MLRDLRFGLRQLRGRPLWTTCLIAVLSLGIAANTAMFSGFDAWVLRELDFAQPDRLVALYESQPALGRLSRPVSARSLGDWREAQRSFSALGAYARQRFNLSDDGEPVRVAGCRVTASLFPLLGKAPALGRAFRPEEDLPGAAAAVALISDRLWRERYGGEATVLGRRIRLDGQTHEIVGVMAPGFRFPEWAEVWTPLGVATAEGARDRRWLSVIGRRAPDVSLDDARAEMAALGARIAAEHPATNRGWSVGVEPLRDDFVPDVITVALTASLGAGIFVMLVICANVAGLMLAQASARTRELALRTALGASRGRLLRQSVAEALLLALPAGVIGMVLAHVAVRWQHAMVPVEPPYLFAMSMSPRSALYTLAVSLLAGVTCALAPVLRATGIDVSAALAAGGSRAGGSPAAGRLRGGLVIAELALSTALMVGALLMVKSYLHQQQLDPGYRTGGIVTAELALSGEGYRRPAERIAAVERLRAALESMPGVGAVALSDHLPASPRGSVRLEPAERTLGAGEDVEAAVHAVAGPFLETLDVPLLAGRRFTDGEMRDGGPVAVVGAGLARKLWGGTDVVGNRLRRVGGGEVGGWRSVIGVVGDVTPASEIVEFGGRPNIQLYLPYAERASEEIAVVVRSDRPLRDVATGMRAALRSALPGVPVSEVLTMEDAIFRVQWVSRLFSHQLALYALLATLITALGLYGLTAESVIRRFAELAIRTALGATPASLLRLVLRQVLLVGTGGIGLGALLAVLTTRLGASMLLDVRAGDPGVFAGVALLLFAVIFLAGYLPARRAARLDPAQALRSE